MIEQDAVIAAFLDMPDAVAQQHSTKPAINR